MNVKIINPFLAAAINVLKTMANVDPKPGKPFLKDGEKALGDVSAIIGLSGVAQGTMALTFSASCITAIVTNLFGSPITEIDGEVKDAVGELTNMICGDARRRLAEEGIGLQAGIPEIISGTEHSVTHLNGGPKLVIPFETPNGSFVVEVTLNK